MNRFANRVWVVGSCGLLYDRDPEYSVPSVLLAIVEAASTAGFQCGGTVKLS